MFEIILLLWIGLVSLLKVIIPFNRLPGTHTHTHKEETLTELEYKKEWFNSFGWSGFFANYSLFYGSFFCFGLMHDYLALKRKLDSFCSSALSPLCSAHN